MSLTFIFDFKKKWIPFWLLFNAQRYRLHYDDDDDAVAAAAIIAYVQVSDDPSNKHRSIQNQHVFKCFQVLRVWIEHAV